MKVYSLHQTNIMFGGKLNTEGTPHDLTGYTALYVIFTRPDGTIHTMTAQPKDPFNLKDTEIQYQLLTDILIQSGIWHYTLACKKSHEYTESPYPELFEVR